MFNEGRIIACFAYGIFLSLDHDGVVTSGHKFSVLFEGLLQIVSSSVYYYILKRKQLIQCYPAYFKFVSYCTVGARDRVS